MKKRKLKLGSARKKAESQSQPFERTAFRVPDGMEVFKLKEQGRKRIEILPVLATERNRHGVAGSYTFEATYYANRLGADNQAYVSPSTFKQRCPVLDEYARLKNDPNADEDVVKSLRKKERQLFYVIDHDEPEKGVQLWDMSYWLFGKQLDETIKMSDEEDDFDQFFDPSENGLTVKLGVVEDQFAGNKFFKVATIAFAKRKDEIDEELWEDLEPLENLLKVLSYNELKAIMNMEEPEAEEEHVDDPEIESDESEEEVVASVVGTDDNDDDWDEDDEDWE